MGNYDVFISYRRDSGAAEARLLQLHLKERHIRCFLDVTELGRGYFDEALLRHIEQTPNFVVILSPDSLNRSENDEDWLRKEIAHALKTDRNVVPLMLPKFEFPARLPEDIRNLPRCQGVEYSHRYIDAMLEKLIATLDLPAAPVPEPAPPPVPLPEDPLERTRAERALLAEERQKLADARLSAERLRDETDELRRRIEKRNAEKARQLQDGSRAGGNSGCAEQNARVETHSRLEPHGRGDSVPRNEVRASPEVRQAAAAAFWLSLVAALSLLSAPFRGSGGQVVLVFGFVFLALAIWVRTNPAQAVTAGLAAGVPVTALIAIGIFNGNTLTATGVWFVLFAGAAALGFGRLWLAIRTGAPTTPAGSAAPPPPFGQRFGELIGVAGTRIDSRGLRLFVAARVGAVLALAFILASRPEYYGYRPPYLDLVWVAVALPIALALSFRVLHHPLLSLLSAAVLASVANPLFWRGPSSTAVVVGEVSGVLLLAAAVGEIEMTSLAIWCGSAAAALAGALIARIPGLPAATFFPDLPLGYLMILPVAFSLVFVTVTVAMRGPSALPVP